MRNNRCQGNAVHRHTASQDEEKIEHHVHKTAGGKYVKRGFGVAYGAEHRRTEIIDRGCGNAKAHDRHIQNGVIVKHRLRAHQGEKRTGKYKSDGHANDASDHGKRHRGMHGARNLFGIPCAVKLRDHNACTCGNIHHDIDDQHRQRCGASHRAERIGIARKAADHNIIGHVIHDLQNAGQYDREHKQEHPRKDRSLCQILFSF